MMSATVAEVLHDLAQPTAYPFAVDKVESVQTHISIVFLVGSFVYKLKKPVQLGFLDFSTLDKRRHFCEEEVRLNRRLAADVYLGVVPVTRDAGGLRFEGEGEAVEWAVKMRRLPEDATLERRLLRGEIRVEQIAALARTVARFHAVAERGERIASFGAFGVVAHNMRENFAQTRSHVGRTVTDAVWQRVRARTENLLAERRSMLESRAARGVPCDTHGDLHLDHVYLFPERAAPDDLLIIDCIEFNERFRYADPVADMAFLTMDLSFHGRRDLARCLARTYFAAANDAEGEQLLSLYSAYRAVVRAKVEGMAAAESEIVAEKRNRHLQEARAHWLLALSEMESPSRKPCVVLIGGLPGSGKSTLARGLCEQGDWQWLRSDLVRKELAGLQPHERAQAEHYSDAWSQRTYEAMLRRAEDGLAEGRRILIDANFRKEEQRQPFVELANRWATPLWFFLCEATSVTARERLARRRGDVSDADAVVRARLADEWQPLGPQLQSRCCPIEGDATIDSMLEQALGFLRRADWA